MRSIDIKKLAEKLWQFCQEESIEFEPFSLQLKQAYLPLITQIYTHSLQSDGSPFVVGLNGAQGSGKTTLSKLLKLLLEQSFDLKVVAFSLDDLYLSREQRQSLAENIHPLLQTRGVPGTHDLHRGMDLFEQLKTAREDSKTLIPQFDKAADDTRPMTEWPVFHGRPDLIIFEGWCVGTPPESSTQLIKPVNQLESTRDPDGTWRQFVNQQLSQEYPALFFYIDYQIFLQAPGFDVVYQWRQEQEDKLLEKLSRARLPINSAMDPEQVAEFILYFERLTRHAFKIMPEYADTILTLDKNRVPINLK